MFQKRRILVAAIVLVGALAFVPPAQAANGPNDVVTVSAFVPKSCSFTTTTDTVNFGTYDPIGANASTAITQTYTAHYICTQNDITYTVAFSSANQTGGQCRMHRAASDYLNYSIKDTSNVNFPCNNTAATPAGPPTGAGGGALSYGFTFTLPGGQNTVQTGTYTDTLTATIVG